MDTPLDRACDIGASQCRVTSAAIGHLHPIQPQPIQPQPIKQPKQTIRTNPTGTKPTGTNPRLINRLTQSSPNRKSPNLIGSAESIQSPDNRRTATPSWSSAGRMMGGPVIC